MDIEIIVCADGCWPQAQGPGGHSLARGVRPPGRRVVAAVGDYVVQRLTDAGECKG